MITVSRSSDSTSCSPSPIPAPVSIPSKHWPKPTCRECRSIRPSSSSCAHRSTLTISSPSRWQVKLWCSDITCRVRIPPKKAAPCRPRCFLPAPSRAATSRGLNGMGMAAICHSFKKLHCQPDCSIRWSTWMAWCAGFQCFLNTMALTMSRYPWRCSARCWAQRKLSRATHPSDFYQRVIPGLSGLK